MATKRYRKGETELKVGQWVNFTHYHKQGLCSIPEQIAFVGSNFIRTSEQSGLSRTFRSIAFVSDYRREAIAMHDLSVERSEAFNKATSKVRREYHAKIEAIIKGESHGNQT